MNPIILSRVQGCLMGVAIGDAMGMPWEIMTPEEILRATEGRGVTGFSNPVQRNIKGTMKLKAGDTTDDWQLTRAVAESLIECGRFDIEHCARKHIAELERTHFGWGKTTQDAVLGIKKWFETNGKEGRDPNDHASFERPFTEGKGTGNGVAMKVAPLALLHGLSLVRSTHSLSEHCRHLELLCRDVKQLGALTHDDGRATIGAFALADMILFLLYTPSFVATRKRDQGLFDSMFKTHVGNMEHERLPGWPRNDSFSARLNRVLDSGCFTSAKRLRTTTGTSCFTLESVPFSIGTFLRHPADFRAGVLEAVNAGGDTDSNASMVGAMIGANVGIEEIPDEWKNFRSEYEEAVRLGTELFTAAFKSK